MNDNNGYENEWRIKIKYDKNIRKYYYKCKGRSNAKKIFVLAKEEEKCKQRKKRNLVNNNNNQ